MSFFIISIFYCFGFSQLSTIFIKINSHINFWRKQTNFTAISNKIVTITTQKTTSATKQTICSVLNVDLFKKTLIQSDGLFICHDVITQHDKLHCGKRIGFFHHMQLQKLSLH